MRIGLLGGSFNPAHAGHRHVARLALRRLQLDQVWLLVSPGNPLKPIDGMAEMAERFAGARAIADGRHILATTIESAWGTRFTIDTLRLLRRRFPRMKFVWLMGADILVQLPRWQRWHEILSLVPIAVVPRPGYTRRAVAGQAARWLQHARRREQAAGLLPGAAPGWVLLTAPQTDVSATAIRAGVVKGATP